jgi:transcriptional regulator with XRE-family HTH domain
MDEIEQSLQMIGPRLRSLRLSRETTLSALSGQTGISLSTLSRLESGERRASLELLLPLARAYGVALDELVDASATGDPRIHPHPVKHHGMTMLPLTRRPDGIQPYKITLSGERRTPELKTHEGHEWLYVLSGRLRIILGERDLVLVAGEVAEFDTRLPHWFGSVDAEPTEFLSLFGRQGERAHLRARPKDRDPS